MAARALNLSAYADLLAKVRPTVPHTDAENERLLGKVEELVENENLSPEQEELLEMLLALIQKFENEHYATKRAEPHEVLREMMRTHGTVPKDLYEIFGSKGTTSEVLRGKRGISKAAAKSLAKLFHVSADLFL